MRRVCWLLIGLAALAFVMGTLLAFTGQPFLLPPVGYWRGAGPREPDPMPAEKKL